MESPSLIALSRAAVLERQMAVVANNIANVSTSGYKAQRVLFEVAEEKPIPSQPLDFVTDRATYRDFTTGDIKQTGNELDVALNGDGFFSATLPDGKTAYTRNGSFTLSPEGKLVDPQGNTVQGEGGTEITISPEVKQISIGSDGTISGNGATIGKLQISTFANQQKLQPYGDGYYLAEGIAADPATDTRVIQGAIEGSNVRAVTEMTDMIQVVRSYQSIQNLLNNEHERVRNAISRITRTV